MFFQADTVVAYYMAPGIIYGILFEHKFIYRSAVHPGLATLHALCALGLLES